MRRLMMAAAFALPMFGGAAMAQETLNRPVVGRRRQRRRSPAKGPTEGRAPLIVQQVGDLIAEIARRGVAILLVEQELSIAMRISHRVYVMGHGRTVFEGTPAELKANNAIRKEWLEV
jgi:ABC-type uncharacterized transport system ATPase subunit